MIGKLIKIKSQPNNYPYNIVGMFGLVQIVDKNRVFFQELPEGRPHGGQGWVDMSHVEEVVSGEIDARKDAYLEFQRQRAFAVIKEKTGISREQFEQAKEIFESFQL